MIKGRLRRVLSRRGNDASLVRSKKKNNPCNIGISCPSGLVGLPAFAEIGSLITTIIGGRSFLVEDTKGADLVSFD
jgi:hypothetical protein